jgi:pimeloyl-ACP methyl ester carboxylesterase
VPFVSGNNRGHDFGSPLGWVGNEAIRGGVGWEDFEQSPMDVASWVDFMAGLDVQGVALIGHSFGAPKVTYYQAQRQDARVLGLGIASTSLRQRVDPTVVSLAERMAAEGRGDEPLPWGSHPSIIGFPTFSARTYLIRARIPDLYGLDSADPLLARVRCPIFACYGSDDIGGAAELEIIRRNATSAARVETVIFEGANHGYETREPAVAAALGRWVHGLS